MALHFCCAHMLEKIAFHKKWMLDVAFVCHSVSKVSKELDIFSDAPSKRMRLDLEPYLILLY